MSVTNEEEAYKQFLEQMAGSEKFHQTVLKELETLLEQQAKAQAKSIFESGMSLNEKLRLAEEKIQYLERLLNEENVRVQQLIQEKENAEEASGHALDDLNSGLQDLQNKFESQRRIFDKSAYEWDLEKKKLIKKVSLAEKNLRNAQHISAEKGKELKELQQELDKERFDPGNGKDLLFAVGTFSIIFAIGFGLALLFT